MKIALIGDSVFDNQSYIHTDELDTVGRLREAMPDHECVLHAVDGAVTEDVITRQIPSISTDTKVVFVSSGGNDALQYADVLYEGFAAETLQRLHQAQTDFADVYRRMVVSLKELETSIAVFTIYSGNFPDETVQRGATVAISIFDDVIYRTRNELRVPVTEMRDICSGPAEYANEIEPSSLGSRKIARAMQNHITRIHG